MQSSIDFLSLAIGAAGAAAAFFFTGFLREAGKDCYGWLRNRFFPRPPQTQSSPASVTVKIESDRDLPQVIDQDQRAISQVSPKQILEEVKRVPPLQRKAVIGRFAGMRVTWDLLYAHGAIRDGGKVYLGFKAKLSDYEGVACKVREADCVDLLHANPGAKVRVTGTVEDVAMGDVHLEDVTLKVLEFTST